MKPRVPPPTRETTKALLIGGGAIAAQTHIPAAIKLLGRDALFVAEPDSARRSYLAAKFRLRQLAADYHDLLDEVDMALVLTPPHLHAPAAIDCLRAHLPVLCEKPLANTSAECRSMLDAAEASAQLLAVCHNFRYFPNRRRLRHEIRAGTFGDQPAIEILEGAPTTWPSQTGYTFRKELSTGGVLLNNGLHSLDFLLWCLGPPDDISYRDDSIGGLESNAEVELGYGTGASARLHISRTCRLSNDIVVRGDGRSMSTPTSAMRSVWVEGVEEDLTRSDRAAPRKMSDVALAQLADFIGAVRDATPAACGGIDGMRVIELVERCYERKRRRALPDRAPRPGLMF